MQLKCKEAAREEKEWGVDESEKWGELDYGSMSALTHWPYLLNARQKQIWDVHGERCGTQAWMYARELISCQQCRACKSECPYRDRPCAIERLAAIPR